METLTRWFRLAMFRIFGLIHRDHLTPMIEELKELEQYTDRSGHLTNRYKAGRRVREHAILARTGLQRLWREGGLS